MQPRTGIAPAVTLSAAIFFGTAAIAGDLPKEGPVNFTYSAFGTLKATPIGKDRLLATLDENGLTVGNGFGDHMTWHCFGLIDIASGMAQHHGNCVGTDPAGDQVAGEFASNGKYAADAKSFSGTTTLTTGTGKYTGISARWTYVGHGPEFRSASEGTVFDYNTNQGSYKLP